MCIREQTEKLVFPNVEAEDLLFPHLQINFMLLQYWKDGRICYGKIHSYC